MRPADNGCAGLDRGGHGGRVMLLPCAVRRKPTATRRRDSSRPREPPAAGNRAEAEAAALSRACAKRCWRGPTRATARHSTPSRRTRWRSSNALDTSPGCGTRTSAPTPHHLQSGAENRRHARERRPEPEQRGRHLLPRPPRRADHRSAEGGAAGIRSQRERLRRGAHGPHGVRIVAGVRRDARRRLRRTSLHGARPRDQRAAGTSHRQALGRRRSTTATSSTRRRHCRGTRSTYCCGSIRRARRHRACPRTATFPWSGRKTTVRAASSTARCRTAPRPGTSATSSSHVRGHQVVAGPDRGASAAARQARAFGISGQR